MSVKKLQSSTQTYLSHIIDYAGLFPPALLSLDEAIRNYAEYQQHADAWMLGRFVMPVGRITELEAYLHLFSADRKLDLSVTGRPADTETWLKQFRSDMKTLADFKAEHSNLVTVSMLELPLPSGVLDQSLFKKAAAETGDAQVFFEVTTPLHSREWEQHIIGTLDQINYYNDSAKQKIGFKLRMGGVTADAFPTAEQAAFVLKACSDRNIPQKFTAGLHHPVRMYREEVQTDMHGFLNVFTAAMLGRVCHLEQNEIAYILTDQHADHFSFQKDGFMWKELKVHTEEIRQLRAALYSFGSCSFEEPREDLQALRLL
ncbi:hypothetical protein JMA_35950 [Jeotgalibacillus malaysiensis]|uniref:Uncharacterized protein n=1 Tax=Jeotgalibacillus malaysiensis TaxID=1508404 RepID=A0A0B5AW41_9BACL|nr:hypothetical protein [Jeotgalibacillus malaysiensis]AJD92912.1 hypothetical protein JMA_35950 [Jeotgalibacillus malaysiensis]